MNLLVALLGYVFMQVLVGAWVARRVVTEEDYIVAGRRLGPVMSTASIFATWFGAETCVGAASEIYQHGFGAVSSDPFGYGLCLLLFGVLIAGPLWSQRLTTLADLYRVRFSPLVERCVALLMIPSSILWAGAQIRAFGHVVAASGAMDREAATLLAAGVAVTYTVFGGLLADAYADLVQGTVLITCLLVLAACVVLDVGGVTATVDLLATDAAATMHAPRTLLATLDGWAVPVLGSLFAQELAARTLGSRSRQVAQRSALAAALIYMAVGLIPVILGAIAHATLPGAEPEQVLAQLARKHMNDFGYVLFAGALVSAILSTVDSALLVCGSLVSHNLASAFWRHASERQKVRIARASVFGFGVVAYGLAHTAESVHDLVQQASAFGSSGIVVTGLAALFSNRGGPAAALTSLVTGATSFFYFNYLSPTAGAYLWSLASALAGFVAACWLGAPRHDTELA